MKTKIQPSHQFLETLTSLSQIDQLPFINQPCLEVAHKGMSWGVEVLVQGLLTAKGSITTVTVLGHFFSKLLYPKTMQGICWLTIESHDWPSKLWRRM